MPPPAASDPWLLGRKFGIVIDAGSSGSRLQIYSWKDPRQEISEKGKSVARSLPVVEKGAREGEEWVTKIEPGLSSFSDHPDDIPKYLSPLLNHARNQVPPSLQHETPLFLLATAGMRLLPPQKQAEVLQETCKFLRLHSNFRIDVASSAGPCGSSVRIITGEEEGLYGWIAVNYLMDGFSGPLTAPTTYGFLDMGGASTQIAFEPSKVEQDRTPNLIEIRLRLLGGAEIRHKVFVTTWLGYGTNQARERYVGKLIDEFEKSRSTAPLKDSATGREIIEDPCLPQNLELTENPIHDGEATAHSRKAHKLLGTGSFEKCMQKTQSLLNKNAPCPDSPCLFNGVHTPPIDFSVSHFIGVSEYWYSSDHVFGLGGPYDFVQYEHAASDFCSRNWSNIVKEHEESRMKGQLGGDGEVEKHGKIVETGRWGDKVETSRLQMQCFKAAWIANVLHEGIGMPRLVDPGGNATTPSGEKVAEQAERKGLGRPAFQSMDSVGDIAISWTLGKMVLEASKEVPLPMKLDKPLHDPLDDIPDISDFPIQPIRPPFLDILEKHIQPHLPTSLSRSALGFSPVLLLIAVVFFAIMVVTFRLRNYLRVWCRRMLRGTLKRDFDVEEYSLADGRPLTNGNTSPWKPLKQIFTTPTKPKLPPLSTSTRKSISRSESRTSLSRTPIPKYEPVAATSSTQYNGISRPGSPVATLFELDDLPMANGVSPLGSISRSRNSSQLNLNLTRTGAISRTNSTLFAPGVTTSRDE